MTYYYQHIFPNQMTTEIAQLLKKHFCSNQTSFITQQVDGTYLRTYGTLSVEKIENSISSKGSVGSYQKNQDSTVRWICFDFDVDKKHIGKEIFENILEKLNGIVDAFCLSLTSMNLPYLLEFSGNRGMHVWLTFHSNVQYEYAFIFLEKILHLSGISSDDDVKIDLFPGAPTHSAGVGKGVKLPLSRHTKSKSYALLLPLAKGTKAAIRVHELTQDIIDEQINILLLHRPISIADIERIVPDLPERKTNTDNPPVRIKSITTDKRFGTEILFIHWKKNPPLAKIANHIIQEQSLSLGERKLLVGMLGRIKFSNDANFGMELLQSIFKKLKNYDEKTTNAGIESLSGFHFPSQTQIENVCGIDFGTHQSQAELLTHCIPHFYSFSDETLEISLADIEITRAAEFKYLFQNDEVRCQRIIHDLKTKNPDELLANAKKIISGEDKSSSYTHLRREALKTRKLISQHAECRIATSSILHQIAYAINFKPSSNSHGYQLVPGFKGGFIFKPWLDLWVRFIGNVGAALKDQDNKNFYIVKTDISSFYDSVPHENIKRLLMGGVNSKIDAKTNIFTSTQRGKYQALLEGLFRINSDLAQGTRGLPQGPAYARFLSEIYLDNIDQLFDADLCSGEIVLYQRYVDDIFFICKTHEGATAWLKRLNSEITALGLVLNPEKTILSKIEDFNPDFEKFSDQSKYVVDRAGKGFDTATDVQRDLALSEFMNIVQSEDSEADLTFIFSHLDKITALDEVKEKFVLPTLQRGIGRGSMLRHLFSFVLKKAERWQLLLKIEIYDELQSEVLTSCVLQYLAVTSLADESFIALFNDVIPKLRSTNLTKENLTYISLLNPSFVNPTPNAYEILHCLATHPALNKLEISDNVVNALSLTINSIQSMGAFVNLIYPLCISSNTSRESLNLLAQTFYAKISNDYARNDLKIGQFPELEFLAPLTKFYNLLCLFSLSGENDNIEVLKAAWKFATDISNKVASSRSDLIHDGWFEKLELIAMSQSKHNLVVSSIIDGALYRGGQIDKHKIYEAFHHRIIIFIAGKALENQATDLQEVLERLKLKANFYKWILEKENVSRFPSHHWFEKNVCENDLIILKKNSEVLIRRPTDNFLSESSIQGEHNGYGEIIESYDQSLLVSAKQALSGLSITQKIDRLIAWVEINPEKSFLPNIFSQDKLIQSANLMPFTNEIIKQSKILFEDGHDNISIHSNTTLNFIKCFFQLSFDDGTDAALNLIWSKYISNLPGNQESLDFLKLANNELKQILDVSNSVHVDFAMAAALYSSSSEQKAHKKIKDFVDSYEKFNKSPEQQNVYCVDYQMKIDDATPTKLFESIANSLRIVTEKVMPSTLFGLNFDVETYQNEITSSLDSLFADISRFDLSSFAKTRVYILRTEQKVAVSVGEFPFSAIQVVNVGARCVEPYEEKHSFNLRNAQHAYFFKELDQLYLLPISPAISKIYLSLEKRYAALISGKTELCYPTQLVGKLDFGSLSDFDKAVRNVSAQQDISIDKAEDLLKNWLISLPKIYHVNLCTLIAAHIVMQPSELNEFLNSVERLVKAENSNVFFIKKMSDVNGTQRILIRRPELMRTLADRGPSTIKASADCATLIVDLVVSGNQISNALRHYACGDGIDLQYFDYSDAEKHELKEKLKALKTIYICQVFYTSAGIEHIQNECRKFLSPALEVLPLGGKNIDTHALFGKSEAIGENQKNSLRNMFNDKALINTLFDHLRITNRTKDSCSDFKNSQIDKTDLVGRYQSLPKRCFYFLHAGTLHNEKCVPFMRTREIYEMPSAQSVNFAS